MSEGSEYASPRRVIQGASVSATTREGPKAVTVRDRDLSPRSKPFPAENQALTPRFKRDSASTGEPGQP